MEIVDKIIISVDFSDTPGARYRTDGGFSGELFYDGILLPKFEKALEKKGKLVIDFDDSFGYASSFISASFGRLSLKFGSKAVLQYLDFKSEDDPLLIKQIKNIIENPKKK